MSWDDDPRSVGAIDLLQNNELDIDIDAGERTTAIPAIPMDQLVQATMAEADARELDVVVEGRREQPTVADWQDSSSSPTANHKPIPAESHELNREGAAMGRPLSTQPAPARTGSLKDRDAELSAGSRALSDGDVPASSQGHLLQSRLVPTEPPRGIRTPAGTVGPISSRPPASRDPLTSSPPTLRRSDVDHLRHQMKDRYATGDFSGALELAESLLTADSGDLEAQRFATSCRDVLTQMLTSRIGSFEQTVEVALSPEELRWLTLDHRAGFFLSLVDGASTIEELLDISGMARLESLRILSALLDQRVLRVLPH